MNTIAALYVDANGPYAGIDGIDLWPEKRDARKYAGPHPVIAHPPCQRWGRFHKGSVRKGTPRLKLGDDGGCFIAALEAVRTYGGVLEHPANSHAWDTFGIRRPDTQGHWKIADTWGGYTCQVWQGWYGHLAPKATWLYALGTPLPNLRWGKSVKELSISNLLYYRPSMRLFDDVPDVQSRRQVTRKQRRQTPHEFRDILIAMAREASPNQAPPPIVTAAVARLEDKLTDEQKLERWNQSTQGLTA